MVTAQQQPTYTFTQHPLHKMHARRLSADAVTAALAYGRAAWTRGARIYAIGRREVERYRTLGVDLDPFEGVQVVTKPDGAILTVYRNRDLRGLRRGNHLRHRRSAW
ncbi:MAG: hypothetical protein IT340_22405 [Chloroflexi bacterium]|nr:hypothetical protein [Chloroflexota bacterium]